MPHAIGIAERRLRRNTSRGETPSSAASARASGSHGASVTRSVRRDSHEHAEQAGRRGRASTSPAPTAQISEQCVRPGDVRQRQTRAGSRRVGRGPAPAAAPPVRAVCVRRCGAGAIARGRERSASRHADRVDRLVDVDGTVTSGKLPARQRERQHRQGQRADQRERPHQVARGGRAPGAARAMRSRRRANNSVALQNGVRQRQPAGSGETRGEVRNVHGHAPVPRAWSISRASRSSSASDRFEAESSSNAEIACSVDPSKNVFST